MSYICTARKVASGTQSRRCGDEPVEKFYTLTVSNYGMDQNHMKNEHYLSTTMVDYAEKGLEISRT